jgi:hypothetical protein
MNAPASRKNPQPIHIGETRQEAAEMLQQLVNGGVLEIVHGEGGPILGAWFRSANHPGGIVYGVKEGVEGLSLVPERYGGGGGENVRENEEKRGSEGECPRTGTGPMLQVLREDASGLSANVPFASPAGAEPT